MSKVIVIDAGHGGADTGARGLGYNEKDLTLSDAILLKNKLTTMYQSQVRVLLTRDTDKFINLTNRRDYANRVKADVMVSLHMNSSINSASGWEIFSTMKSAKGTDLAKSIHKEVQGLVLRDRGIKHEQWTVITCNASSVLIETAFINSKADMENYIANRDKLITAYARGIGNYLNLKAISKQEHWGEKHYKSLINKGLEINEKRFDDNMTRAEVFALLDRIYKE